MLLVPVGAALAGVQAIRYWLRPPDERLPLRVPRHLAYDWGEDFRKRAVKARNTGTLIAGDGSPSSDPGSWPQFRGADRTNVASPAEKLFRQWPESGPEVLWQIEVGEGHAGAAVHKGRVYLIDYDRQEQEDAIRCLSLADAKEIWRYTYSVAVKRNHGMSRTMPAVSDDYVVTLGPKGHVVCLKATTGEFVWKMDLVKDYGTTIPPWYAGQCPLIDGDRVILAPGGNSLIMAVQLATGEILWKTPNADGWGMSHSSIIAMDYQGERQYVYSTTRGVVGVRAADGAPVWKTSEWRVRIASIASPVVIAPDRLFFSGGYGSGCAMFRLSGPPGNIKLEELFRLKPEVFGSPQHTPIFYKDHLWGVVPDGELVCLGLDGNRVWASGTTERFGLGPFLVADDLVLVLQDMEGTLHLVETAAEGYREVARAKVLDGHDAWGPMALVNGKLILRDYDHMVCLRVGSERK